MIVIRVTCGLGNQLYQYALYEKLKSLGKEVKLDTFYYGEEAGDEREWRRLELDRFPKVSYAVATPEDREAMLDNNLAFHNKVRRKLFGRKNKTCLEDKEYMPEIYDMDDVYLYGFWMCEKYYEDMIPLLQQRLQFPESGNTKNIECMNQMRKENSVSLHIRRTDYLSTGSGDRYTGICTDEYYDTAMQYIEKYVENPVYYIFSDDTEFAREYFNKENMRIIDWNTGDDSIYDMQLMSCCKHNICANSTFSIWGARLNENKDKIMIRPLRHDNYETTTEQQNKEYWKNWILVDKDGTLV